MYLRRWCTNAPCAFLLLAFSLIAVISYKQSRFLIVLYVESLPCSQLCMRQCMWPWHLASSGSSSEGHRKNKIFLSFVASDDAAEIPTPHLRKGEVTMSGMSDEERLRNLDRAGKRAAREGRGEPYPPSDMGTDSATEACRARANRAYWEERRRLQDGSQN